MRIAVVELEGESIVIKGDGKKIRLAISPSIVSCMVRRLWQYQKIKALDADILARALRGEA